MDLEKYLNKEYKFNGRGKEGYDCLGLVFSILHENNIKIPISDGENIQENWMIKNPMRLVKHFKNYGTEIKIGNQQKLDVAIFEIDNVLRHAAIFIDQYRIIHIFDDSKVRISKFSRWKKRLHSIWRVR